MLDGCNRIAGYLAIRGEISLQHTLVDSRRRAAVTAVPMVTGEALRFIPVDDGTRLIEGAFGIQEPATDAAPIEVMSFDVVLVPLLAFDDSGNRLGMGGGFYDRCLAPLRERRRQGLATPTLIGVAHAFQQVPALQPEPWDVPLDQVVTESGPVPVRNIR